MPAFARRACVAALLAAAAAGAGCTPGPNYSPRDWVTLPPDAVGLLLQRARQEVRNYVGVSQDAAPQAVIDAFYGASRALRANDTAAAERILAPPVVPSSRQVLGHLAAMPLLPIANQATARAAQELDRVGRIGGRGGGGVSGGGGGRN